MLVTLKSVHKSHTESRVALSSIPEKKSELANYEKEPCACVGLVDGENHLCQWGSIHTALVEQVLHRESSNTMQLIHTKTSLNLSLTTIGYRLSAFIVGGARDHPCEAK